MINRPVVHLKIKKNIIFIKPWFGNPDQQLYMGLSLSISVAIMMLTRLALLLLTVNLGRKKTR